MSMHRSQTRKGSRHTFSIEVTQRFQFSCDPLKDRGVDRLEGWIRVRIKLMGVVGQGHSFRRRIEHDTTPPLSGIHSRLRESAHQPLTGQCSKDC